MGESLKNIVKTRLQAVISQNNRDEVRKNIALYLLGILMIALIWEMGKAIVKPNTIFIENAHASMVELPSLAKVAEGEVSKADSSSQREEHGEEVSKQIPQVSDIEQMILEAFGEDGKIMVAIAKAESGQNLNPKAHNLNRNGSTDTGVFQINSIHGYDQKWLQDPKNNIEAAKRIKNTQGLTAWVAYSNGNYKYNL